RMLFLTATPFQLGHHELVRVLERFGDVRWDEGELSLRDQFVQKLTQLEADLNDSQRSAIALQRSWSRLRPDDCDADVESWWHSLLSLPPESRSHYQQAVVNAFFVAKKARDSAEAELRPWIVRHNKGAVWAGTHI